MDIGIVGLGRMGANIARRLAREGLREKAPRAGFGGHAVTKS